MLRIYDGKNGVKIVRINIKTFVLNTSLVVLIALCVFSPIYQYQKMTLIAGCFLLWGVATTQIDMSWFRRVKISLMYLGGMFFLYVWSGIALGDIGTNLNYAINQLPVYIWFVILEFYLDKRTMLKKTVIAFFVLFLITTYFTIAGNMLYPGASRLLANTLQYYAAQRAQYRTAFIGGYDIIYGAVFLVMPLTLLARKHKWVWLIVFALFVMVVVSSYTIAIILMIFMIICGMAKAKNIWKLAGAFCGVILIVTVFEQQILSMIAELAQRIDSEILGRRLTSLVSGEYFREFGDDNNRLTIYFNEILNWLDHPIFGNLITPVKEYRRAGHSTLLMYLSQFGLLSVVIYAYLKRYYTVVKRALSAEYRKYFSIYFFFFVVFGLIDRYETFLTIGVCVFFIAPALFIMADGEGRKYENSLVNE